jgi:hypothetical protein
MRRPIVATALLVAAALGTTGSATAAPSSAVSEEKIFPVQQYTSEKAKQLGATYEGPLRQLETSFYHCLPWVEVEPQSIGFFRPRGASEDQRYLSIRFYVDQEPSAQFAALGRDGRIASMFSRYVGPVLQRMTRGAPELLRDPLVDGFSVVVTWLKQVPKAGDRPVHEAIATFVDRDTAVEYVGGGLNASALASRARVLAFDGDKALGPVAVSAWDDDFVATYKVKNYQLAAGVSCQ